VLVRSCVSKPVSSTSCSETGSTNPTSTAKPEKSKLPLLKPKEKKRAGNEVLPALEGLIFTLT